MLLMSSKIYETLVIVMKEKRNNSDDIFTKLPNSFLTIFETPKADNMKHKQRSSFYKRNSTHKFYYVFFFFFFFLLLLLLF